MLFPPTDAEEQARVRARISMIHNPDNPAAVLVGCAQQCWRVFARWPRHPLLTCPENAPGALEWQRVQGRFVGRANFALYGVGKQRPRGRDSRRRRRARVSRDRGEHGTRVDGARIDAGSSEGRRRLSGLFGSGRPSAASRFCVFFHGQIPILKMVRNELTANCADILLATPSLCCDRRTSKHRSCLPPGVQGSNLIAGAIMVVGTREAFCAKDAAKSVPERLCARSWQTKRQQNSAARVRAGADR
jgi:hypothetical protein